MMASLSWGQSTGDVAWIYARKLLYMPASGKVLFSQTVCSCHDHEDAGLTLSSGSPDLQQMVLLWPLPSGSLFFASEWPTRGVRIEKGL